MKRPPTEAPLFVDLSILNIRDRRIGPCSNDGRRNENAHPQRVCLLLAVGNTTVFDPPAAISAEHSAKLIKLGYMADLERRLRMTTPGRLRIAAGISN
jgi:hypothetical protein